MRHFAIVCFLLALTGCDNELIRSSNQLPFSTGNNPNMPVGDSENMRRVEGVRQNSPPLTPEPGDVWPGPITPPPTLQDLERAGGPGTEPLPPVGSSTPPGSNQPLLSPLPSQAPPPQRGAPVAGATGRPSPRIGTSVQTPRGAGTVTGSGPGYQTLTTPGGGQAIVVPNGNGTSTVIRPDGTVETIPTPK